NVRYATMLASTSNCMANQLRKVMNDENLQIYITPFGVNTDLFSPEKYPAQRNDQEIVICNIKMLEPKYGIKQIILAVDLMVRDSEFMKQCGKKIKLNIFGSGSQKDELEDLVKRKGLSDVVKFCG